MIFVVYTTGEDFASGGVDILTELKCDVADAITADNYFNEYAPSTSDMYIADRYERIVKTTKNQHNGTATMLKPDLFKFSKTADIETPRIVMQRIKSETINILIGSIYMPTDGDKAAQQKYREMANTVIAQVTELRQDAKVVLIGDFNIQKKHTQQRWQIFNSILSELDLKLHTPDTYTNSDYRGNKSTLDYIICSQDVTVSEIDVYHMDRFPGNSSTHSPIFATIEFKENIPTKNIQEEVKEGLDSPFSSYLSRKRPNWDNIDMNLFHKLSSIKVDSVWHTIENEKSDIKLNAIINILVRSALDASAGKQDRDTRTEPPEMKNLKELLSTVTLKLKNMKTKTGKVVEECDETYVKANTDKDTIVEYNRLIKDRKSYRRKMNALQYRMKNLTYATRNSIMNKALKRGAKEGFQMVRDTVKPKRKKGEKNIPEIIQYNGKTYRGADALNGFYDVAADLARDPKTDVINTTEPNKLYKLQADVVEMEEFLIGKGQTQVKPLTYNTYNDLLKQLAKGKSPDISGSQVEHFLYAPTQIKTIMMGCINDMLQNTSLYNSPTFGVSVSTMIHKGKGKPVEKHNSYRRISVGPTPQKIIDTYMSKDTGDIAKKAQPNIQFGFTEKKNYLEATVLRETVQVYSEEADVALIFLTSDVTNAFLRTDRTSQLYELIRAGEHGKYWEYSFRTYTGTATVLYGDKILSGGVK